MPAGETNAVHLSVPTGTNERTGGASGDGMHSGDGSRPGDLNAQWYTEQRAAHRGKRCENCRDFRRPAEGSTHGVL